MKLTEIELFKNTPFTDFQNTIHFGSNDERDKFFNTAYETIKFQTRFNFVKDRLELNLQVTTQQTYGVNYCRFRNEFDNNSWYYAFIMTTQYTNDGVTQFGLVLDTVMTFLQGDFTKYLNQVNVKRQSLDTTGFNKYSDWLMTNQDTLVFPKRYTHQKIQAWNKQNVIFTCSVDLMKSFGTSNNPTMQTSNGQTYDSIVSPLNLYLCKTQKDFTALMNAIKVAPWVSQNIQNVAIVPSDMVDQSKLERLPKGSNTPVNQCEIYRFIDGTKTVSHNLDDLDTKPSEYRKDFDFSEDVPAWCLREQYCSIDMLSWDGQRVSLDPVYLPVDDGIKIYGQSTFGYHNEIRIFPDRYQTGDNENSITGLWRGTYSNNAIIFKNFDDIPVLIDNYRLYKANTAHTRELANQRTFTGRINEVADSKNSLQDRFFNAVELTTSLAGGVASHAMSQLTDEYEYYRTQKAELADKAIAAPSVSEQNNSQSFNIAHDIYGVTLKFSSIGNNIMRVIMYHNTFGFDFGGQIVPVESITSLPIMNYLSCSGNFTIPNVPSQFVQQLKITLENGVKFWHNNGSANPFTQNLIANKK